MNKRSTPSQNLEDQYTDAFSSGEFFKAYDLAHNAFLDNQESLWGHRAVLSLANAGATQSALSMFENLGLNQIKNSECLGLQGRLHKDSYFANPERNGAHLNSAIKAYQEAFEVDLPRFNVFPAINLAALYLFDNKIKQAHQLAHDILNELDKKNREKPNYWDMASKIEALLILGQTEALPALLEQAKKANHGQYAQLSSTAKQLQRLCTHLGLASDFLKALWPPAVIHFTGHIVSQTGRFRPEHLQGVRQRIDAILDNTPCMAAYGSLAAGADILFAQACLQRNISLNVILPFERKEFIEVSVRPSGSTWVEQFEQCIAQAQTIRFATEDAYLHDNKLFAYTSELAMGLATVCARHMNTEVIQLAVWDGQGAHATVGTGFDVSRWNALGRKAFHIPVSSDQQPNGAQTNPSNNEQAQPSKRQVKAMLFGDVVGFSQLNDVQLPLFVQEFLACIGQALAPFKCKAEQTNTWGDGLFMVFNDPLIAADCALGIQQSIAKWRASKSDLPDSLNFRIGLHAGPVYSLQDPITEKQNVYGAHVSRAARIEPVAPAGSIYVTETMAALLSMTPHPKLVCDYVGFTESAKAYGAMRMFLLRPANQTETATSLRLLS